MKKLKKKHHIPHYQIYTYALLPVMILGLWMALPPKITLVHSDLEDVEQYFIALKIKTQKEEFQKTLPEGALVVEVYTDQPKYFAVKDTCNWAYVGECISAATGPGPEYPEASIYYANQGPSPAIIREGQVFPMSALVKGKDESLWYKIALDTKKTLFPNRFLQDWYVPAEHFTLIDFTPINPENNNIKKIVIVLHEQTLYAYEGENVFMKTKVSTGRDSIGLPTDVGSFSIFKKAPMTIMEGPLPSMVSMMTPENIRDFEYALFVPFAMAFNPHIMGIAYIHEAYWHNGFGTERSHGCVNVSPQDALALYNWVPDPTALKIPVTVLP